MFAGLRVTLATVLCRLPQAHIAAKATQIRLGARRALHSLNARSLSRSTLSARLPPSLRTFTTASLATFASIGSSISSFGSSINSGASSALPWGLPMGLLFWLAVDVAINWSGWAVAAALKTELFYDLLGSVSFATLTAGSLALGGPISSRKILLSAMVGLWTARLGAYLVHRIHSAGKDSRFDIVKHQPGKFFVYWSMQAVWVWVTLLPVLLINGMKAPLALAARPADIAGIVLYVTGLALEAIADGQKAAFRKDPSNHGKFIESGLWSVSRHPNYFGEMMLWSGVFLTATSAFPRPLYFLSILSPLSVMILLRFVSGVPILEQQADSRWGHLPEYQQYKARTPLLVPCLPTAKATHSK